MYCQTHMCMKLQCGTLLMRAAYETRRIFAYGSAVYRYFSKCCNFGEGLLEINGDPRDWKTGFSS